MDIDDYLIDELREQDAHKTCGYLNPNGNTCVLFEIARKDPNSRLAKDGKMWVNRRGGCLALDTENWGNCPEYTSGDDCWKTLGDMAQNGPFGNGSGGSRERK